MTPARAAADAFARECEQRTFSDAGLLRSLARVLEHRRADACGVAQRETLLELPRLNGELTRTTRQLEAFAMLADSGEWLEPIIDRADPESEPARPDQRRVNVPIGPVAVFSAGNFPFAFGVVGGDTASALAAGCPVVAKAHPGHRATSRLLADCVAEAVAAVGAPTAWFAHVEGGNDSAAAVVEDAAIEAVAFTGSFQGGTALSRIAGARPRPIPVYAEMGSVNPFFVTAAAAAARAADISDGLAASITGSCGQLCTKPGLVVLVDNEHGRRLAARLGAALAAVPPAAMLGDRIAGGFRVRLDDAMRDRRTRVLVAPRDEQEQQGAALLEAALADLRPNDPLVEEIFGPAALVVWARDDADLVTATRLVQGSLTATVHFEEGDDVAPLLTRLARCAGRVVANGYPTGVTVGWATVHGGPFPATTSSAHTSVGLTAIRRFVRPVGYQSVPDALLPPALRNANPRNLVRRVDGALTRDPV